MPAADDHPATDERGEQDAPPESQEDQARGPDEADPLATLGVALGEIVAVDGGKRVLPRPQEVVEVKPPAQAHADPVEVALAKALERAADAGQWEVVKQLASQLEERKAVRKGRAAS